MLWLWVSLGVLGAVVVYDLVQRKHAILRSFPIIGHLRYLLMERTPHDLIIKHRTFPVRAPCAGEPFGARPVADVFGVGPRSAPASAGETPLRVV